MGRLLDLDDFLNGLRGDPASGCGTRVGGDDNTTLEPESESCGTMGNLYGAVWVGMVICCSTEKCGGLL